MSPWATVVFPNGRIVRFRPRGHKFKVVLVTPDPKTSIGKELLDKMDVALDNVVENISIVADDCDGNVMGFFMRFVMESAPAL